MIQVALCDDDVNVIETVSNYLRDKSAKLENEKLNISVYLSGEDFLNDIEIGATFHIVLMDIQMDGIDGVNVGKALRNRPDGDDIIMVYISSHDGYFEDLVDVGSFRFIRKPINMKQVDDVFTRALNQVAKYKAATAVSSLFKYKIESEIHSIKINDIVYMKHFMRVTELYTWKGVYRELCCINKFYAKLDDITEQLPDDQFVRCERSYIVNLDYVGRMDKNTFVLTDKNETHIPISKGNKQQMKDAYFRHLENIT